MRAFLKRRAVVACLGLALVLGLLYFLFLRQPVLREEDFARIQAGMSESEVAALLGFPAGNYETGVVMVPRGDGWIHPYPIGRYFPGFDADEETYPRFWVTDEAWGSVFFEKSTGKVRDKEFWHVVRLRPYGIRERLRLWFERF
jgi:hypothetical protein